ncbi:hypothetical protein OKW21_000215 [Catalinimonas alkaloidigena]|uniref:Dabb family protein n=1 Tax=Catalinimonas alkaloidigena TaxID=1075417 RepID=UPI0024072F9D|nr:Dabb family protein [Catalinimonas alkaloidigena]MDF9794952.1 hypothetical protein [Catalinimonas alkaloidigena]
MEKLSTMQHHVFFWLKNPDSKEDLDSLISGLKSMQQIDSHQMLKVGVPAATPKREVVDHSYAVSLLVTFSSVEDHNAYQEDPIHKKFVEDCAHLWDKVQIYDSQDV